MVLSPAFWILSLHTCAIQCSAEYLRETLLQLSRILSVAFFSGTLSYNLLWSPWTLSSFCSIQGLHSVLSGFLLSSHCTVVWKLSEGNKLGRLPGSLHLFPVSQGPLSFAAWCSVLKTIVLHILPGFCWLLQVGELIQSLLFYLGWKATALSIFISSVLILQHANTFSSVAFKMLLFMLCWIYSNNSILRFLIAHHNHLFLFHS